MSARSSHEVGLLLGELLILLAAVAPRDLALLQKALVAAVVDGVGLLGEVEFDHASHAARHELSVVTHQHYATAHAADDFFESREAIEIEVVRGFVEEHDVET